MHALPQVLSLSGQRIETYPVDIKPYYTLGR